MSLKYPKVNRGTSVPPFQLTKSVMIDVERAGTQGYYDENGRWVEATRVVVSMGANVQPAKGWDLLKFPEADRSEDWIKVYTRDNVNTLYEGDGGVEADIVIWNSKRYQVKNAMTYQMGILNHTKALAVRLPVINGGADA